MLLYGRCRKAVTQEASRNSDCPCKGTFFSAPSTAAFGLTCQAFTFNCREEYVPSWMVVEGGRREKRQHNEPEKNGNGDHVDEKENHSDTESLKFPVGGVHCFLRKGHYGDNFHYFAQIKVDVCAFIRRMQDCGYPGGQQEQ